MDVGTGTGRDIKWLRENAFEVRGVDASKSLLAIAQASNPGVILVNDSLPQLSNIEDASVDYVLCSAVLMHLQKCDISRAARSLLRIVKPLGRIICSVRPSREMAERESDGRLYTHITEQELIQVFASHGATIICSHSTPSEVNERCWSTVVVERTK
jgi:ubiquinone/menaquinone biosynthesis C-methylase UbiE